MVQLAVEVELSGLYLHAHLAICVAEGCAGLGAAVDLLHREGVLIFGVFHHVALHLDVLYGVGRDVYAVFYLLKEGDEDLFYYLHVAEVAARQVARDEAYGVWRALNLVAMRADELEDVGVFLVGHDGAAGGHLLGQVDEAEVLAREEAAVKCQAAYGLGYGCQGEGDYALCLAATHLGVDHVICQVAEAEQLGGEGPVEGERAAIAGGCAKGVLVGHVPRGGEHGHVVGQALGICAKPQAERGGHGHLEVRIARDEDVLIFLALGLQHVKEFDEVLGQVLYLVAYVEFEVQQHLVVARAAAVHFLAEVAQLAGQHQLHLRVDVLYVVLYDEGAVLRGLVYVFQLGEQHGQLVMANEAYGLEHGYVGHGAQHVKWREVQV